VLGSGLERGRGGCLGYEDVGILGRAVLAFDEDSPLRDCLPLGILITRLDDVSLGGSGPGAGWEDGDDDIWTLYLTGTYHLTGEERKV